MNFNKKFLMDVYNTEGLKDLMKPEKDDEDEMLHYARLARLKDFSQKH